MEDYKKLYEIYQSITEEALPTAPAPATTHKPATPAPATPSAPVANNQVSAPAPAPPAGTPAPAPAATGTKVPPVSQLMTKMDYVSAVKTLQGLKPDDPKVVEWLKTLEGNQASDKLTFQTGPVPVISMKPMQNEIDFSKSLTFPLSKVPPVSVLASTKESPVNFGVAGMELIVAYINNIYYIVDGHHRWSQVYLCNPNASMQCHVIGGFANPAEALKGTQLAIEKAVLLKNSTLPYSDTDPNAINLLNPNVTDVNFKKKVVETITAGQQKDQVIAAFTKYGYKTPDEIANYLWSNVLKMRQNNMPIKGAPNREFMPQTSGGKTPNGQEVKIDPLKDVVQPLSQGKINVKPNYESVLSYNEFIKRK